jgi:hypothetical protein
MWLAFVLTVFGCYALRAFRRLRYLRFLLPAFAPLTVWGAGDRVDCQAGRSRTPAGGVRAGRRGLLAGVRYAIEHSTFRLRDGVQNASQSVGIAARLPERGVFLPFSTAGAFAATQGVSRFATT